MTRKLEIPSYSLLIPNNTWSKEADPVEHPKTKKMHSATRIMQLNKFKTPSEYEVINLIKKTAGEIDINSKRLKYNGEEENKPIARVLKLLPRKYIEEIAEGNEDIINHVKKHTEILSEQKRTYIQFSSASIPDEMLDSYGRGLDEVGAYEFLLERGLKKLHFKIRLDGKGNFPLSKDLDFLLEQGVRDSYILKTSISYKKYSDLVDQVRLLSRTLTSPEKINRIDDCSYEFLLINTLDSVNDFSRCILGAVGMHKFFGGIKDMIEGMGGKMVGGGFGTFDIEDDYDDGDEEQGFEYFEEWE